MPKIHINQGVYDRLKELAEEENRSLSNMAETILYNVWAKQPADSRLRKEHRDEILRDPKTRPPRVDTPFKQEYPKLPDELKPKFCKEGHPIPLGRSKCLGKGCKYS